MLTNPLWRRQDELDPAHLLDSRMVKEAHRLQIDALCMSQLTDLSLPPNVHFSVFMHCVDIAKRLSHYEGKPTGCILVLTDAELLSECRPLSKTPSSLLQTKVSDDQLIEGSLREALQQMVAC